VRALHYSWFVLSPPLKIIDEYEREKAKLKKTFETQVSSFERFIAIALLLIILSLLCQVAIYVRKCVEEYHRNSRRPERKRRPRSPRDRRDRREHKRHSFDRRDRSDDRYRKKGKRIDKRVHEQSEGRVEEAEEQPVK
jgi:hypothetical protein